MTRKEIIPPGMEIIRERFQYAPGLLVDDTLYIAGQVGRDQTRVEQRDGDATWHELMFQVGADLIDGGF